MPLVVLVAAGCSIDPVNYFGNEHGTPILRANKRGREAEDFGRQQKLQISLNYNICQDEADRSASIPNPNPVSTGLRLSYDDDEHNSSITSASGSMSAAPSIILSLGDNIRTELDRQNDEFDQYIKIQVSGHPITSGMLLCYMLLNYLCFLISFPLLAILCMISKLNVYWD
jgi:E3 ubiquitin-protein ligase BOI-like protein